LKFVERFQLAQWWVAGMPRPHVSSA
jgi:hypothetical protein